MNNQKIRKCKWCGKTFKSTHHKQKYCCSACRKEGDRALTRDRVYKWYHRHKHILHERKRYGLGSGTLGQHHHEDFNKEQQVINNEFRRLRLKKKY